MGYLLRTHDWTHTEVGPMSRWSDEFETALGICLLTQSPVVMYWGRTFEVFYNDAAISLFGPKHPQASLARPCREVFSEVWDALGPIIEGVIGSRRPHVIDKQLFLIRRQTAQQEIYIDATYTPVLTPDGRLVGIHLTCLEKTENVIASRRTQLLQACALAAADAPHAQGAYRACMACIGEAPLDLPVALLYVTSPDKREVELIATTGVAIDDVLGPRLIPLCEPPGGQAPPWPFASVAATRRTATVFNLKERVRRLPRVLEALAPDRAVIMSLGAESEIDMPVAFLVVATSPLQPVDENYTGFLSLLAGVMGSAAASAEALATERQRADALADLDRAKTTFFNNVSHEFRTPLTLMLGPTEQALQSAERSLHGQELEVVHRNQLRLLKLVNSLLDFSAREARHTTVHYQLTDLAAFTKGIAGAFEHAMKEADLRLLIDCPPLPTPVCVDRDMWEKIILNLLSNAYKYTQQGEVHVSLRQTDGVLHLLVRDTGQGIPEADAPKVFDRFHRVGGAQSRTHEGTGIGLALVREFARLHAGEVEVRSTIGAGSTFHVWLPVRLSADEKVYGHMPSVAEPMHTQSYLAEAAHWNLPIEGLSEVQAAGASEGARPIILLADDNLDMREYITRLLQTHYDVTSVGDGQAALDAIRRRRPNLVLTDVMMPNINGLELLRLLRSDQALQAIPVILLTAQAGEDSRVSGFDLRADEYLVKPFSARELLARIASQLRMVEIRQQCSAQQAQLLALAQQEAWLKTLLDVIPSPLFWVDQQSGTIKLCNAAGFTLARLLGTSEQLALGLQHTFTLVDRQGASLTEAAHPFAIARTGGTFEGVETKMRSPNGPMDFLVDAQPIAAGTSDTPTVLVCLREVTNMVQAKERLASLVDARDEFLALASHELRTPLTSLMLQTQLALRKAAVRPLAPEKMVSLLHLTLAQLNRLNALVDDMLDIGRIDGGKLLLRREHFELGSIVQEVVERLRDDLERSVPSLKLEIQAAVQGHWDQFRIEQVVTNLLTNAARYGAGSPVRVLVGMQGHSAVVTVQDEGPGIAQEDADRIFERFERAVNRNEVNGLGLGLFISRQIIHAHGGRLWLEKTKTTGATFVFELPMHEDSSGPLYAKPPRAS